MANFSDTYLGRYLSGATSNIQKGSPSNIAGGWMSRDELYKQSLDLLNAYEQGDKDVFEKLIQFSRRVNPDDKKFALNLVGTLDKYRQGKAKFSDLMDVAQSIGPTTKAITQIPVNIRKGPGESISVSAGAKPAAMPTAMPSAMPSAKPAAMPTAETTKFGVLSNQPRAAQPSIPTPKAETQAAPGRPSNPNPFAWRKKQPLWW